jgi:hypothetical protein
VLLKVCRRSIEGKGAKAALLEIVLHIGGANAMDVGGVEGLLNLDCIGFGSGRCALLALPELHDHRNAGSAAGVLFLFHERNIDPNGWRFCGADNDAGAQDNQQQSDDICSHESSLVLADGHNDQDQGDHSEENDDQIAIT